MPKLAAVLAVLVLACGGSKKDPDRPGDGGDGAGSGSAAATGASTGSGGSATSTGSAATGAITRAECETMVGHIIDIGAAEQPADKRPTPEAIATAKQNMIDSEEDMRQCMAFDRAVHTCVMAASTVAAIQTCLGG